MCDFFTESTPQYFGTGIIGAQGSLLPKPFHSASLTRDAGLDLKLEIRSQGRVAERPSGYPIGTVRRSEEEIEFNHIAGWRSVARGLIEGDQTHRWRADGQEETSTTFSVESFELDFRNDVKPSYLIEWICNLPDSIIWTDMIQSESTKQETDVLGCGDREIRIVRGSTSTRITNALYLQLSGIDLYIVGNNIIDQNRGRSGYIVYRGCPDQHFRDRVRMCISFVIGRFIVYCGHAEYCSNWTPHLCDQYARTRSGEPHLSWLINHPTPLGNTKISF